MENATIGLLFVTIIGWGLWGLLQKMGISKIGAEYSLLLNYSACLLVIIGYLVLIQKLHIPRTSSVVYPILGGIAASVGTLTFFMALEKIPVSIARPLAGLAVLLTALLGILLLDERLTARQYIGVALALASIILLSGE